MTLKEFLQQNKITQKRFAEMLGVKKLTVNCVANGKYNPSPRLALKINTITDGAVGIHEIRKCTMHCNPGCPCSRGKV